MYAFASMYALAYFAEAQVGHLRSPRSANSGHCRHSRNETERRGERYSGLMPADLITLAHFSVSSAMNLPNSAGDSAKGVPPKSAIRSFNLGSARPALT